MLSADIPRYGIPNQIGSGSEQKWDEDADVSRPSAVREGWHNVPFRMWRQAYRNPGTSADDSMYEIPNQIGLESKWYGKADRSRSSAIRRGGRVLPLPL